MRKIAFLINPVSTKKLRCNIEQLIANSLDSKSYTYTISYSTSPEHLTELAKNSVKRQVDIIVAVGGDGTVQRVGKELIGSKSSLGIVPIGSGNGLARHFSISTNPTIALKQLSTGIIKRIDTVNVNNEVALNVAGVGFDGHIAHKFSSSKVRGFWTYLWVVTREYFTYQSENYSFHVDGEKFQTHAFLISICNASQYGNNAVIAPLAKVDDGLIDIVIIKKFSLFIAPYFLYCLFRGKFQKSSHIQTIRCKRVEITSAHLEAHFDGEPFFPVKMLKCEVNSRSLNLVIPILV